MVNMLDYDIVISEFELHSRYYVQLWTNTLEKGMNLIIPDTSYGLSCLTTVLLRGRFWH